MLRFSTTLFLSTVLATWLPAQTDTLLGLPTATVVATPLRQDHVGARTRTWTVEEVDQLPVNDLGELLSTTGVYRKSYGLGSLATSSVRGGAAGHTLVLWNGLPVHSPMLGLLDLSLLPADAFGEVRLTRGGNGALWGSGAVGGVVELRSAAPKTRGIKVMGEQEIGSFGGRRSAGAVEVVKGQWGATARYSDLRADNDFPYEPAPGLPVIRQSNAALHQRLFTQDVYWRPAPGRELAAHAWLQSGSRQVPPTNVQSRSEAFQEDAARRFVLRYQDATRRVRWAAKAAVFDETLNYYDPQIGLESPSGFTTAIGEATAELRSTDERHRGLLGLIHHGTRGRAQNYGEDLPTEHRTALFGSYRHAGKKLDAQLSLRQEMVDGRLLPTVPTLGWSYRVLPTWEVSGKLSRNYRLPTLNDRFWQPGGNPDLRAEQGWSQELSVNFTRDLQPRGNLPARFRLEAGLTAFNRTLRDWIMWYLPRGERFWQAGNVNRVHSRGLEARLNAAWTTAWGLQTGLRLGYDHVRSTNQEAMERPRLAAGDQLFYTPTHQAHAGLDVAWKSLALTYRQQYVGPTVGVNAPLPAFTTAAAQVSYRPALGRVNARLFVRAQNLWNADYFVIENRPMPGRFWRVGVRVDFRGAKN